MSDDNHDEEVEAVEEASTLQSRKGTGFGQIVFGLYVGFGTIVTFFLAFLFLFPFVAGPAGLVGVAIACGAGYFFLKCARSVASGGGQVAFGIASLVGFALIWGVSIPRDP